MQTCLATVLFNGTYIVLCFSFNHITYMLHIEKATIISGVRNDSIMTILRFHQGISCIQIEFRFVRIIAGHHITSSFGLQN